MKKKWYKTWWGILAIVLLFPIFLMAFLTRLIWKQDWKPRTRVIAIALLWGAILIGGMLPDSKSQAVVAEADCIGPDGKKIGLSQKDCEEFNKAWKDKQETVTISITTVQPTTVTPTSTPKPIVQSTKVPTKTPTKKPEKKVEAKKTPEATFESICNKYGGTNNCSYYKDEAGAWSVTQLIQAKEDFMLFSTSKQISRDFIFAVYATKLPMAHASITITMQGKYYRAGLGADMADTQSDSTWTSNDVGPTIFYDFLKSATNGSAGDGVNSTYVETNLD
jgi:hypothetical protein